MTFGETVQRNGQNIVVLQTNDMLTNNSNQPFCAWCRVVHDPSCDWCQWSEGVKWPALSKLPAPYTLNPILELSRSPKNWKCGIQNAMEVLPNTRFHACHDREPNRYSSNHTSPFILARASNSPFFSTHMLLHDGIPLYHQFQFYSMQNLLENSRRSLPIKILRSFRTHINSYSIDRSHDTRKTCFNLHASSLLCKFLSHS